jgi:hypothetical protein
VTSAVATFVAYLIGSISEDVFSRLLARAVPSGRPDQFYLARYDAELSSNFLESQVVRLENVADRLESERDLRIAILAPLVAVICHLGSTDDAKWFVGLLIAPILFGQAWIRTRDLSVARYALFNLRQRVGIPPDSSLEAEARTTTET